MLVKYFFALHNLKRVSQSVRVQKHAWNKMHIVIAGLAENNVDVMVGTYKTNPCTH